MFLWEDFKEYAKELKGYVLGKGLLTLVVMAAGAIGAGTGFGLMPAAVIAAMGGTVLTALSRLHRQSLYEQRMVDFYREGIAAQFHIAPDEVTRGHLHEAAHISPLIAQALERQQKKTILTISTAALASAVSVFLLGAFDAAELLRSTDLLKPLASFIGIGTVSAMSGLVLHTGLDAVIGYSTSIGRASAHDMIVSIDQRIKRGQAISREEVYDVLVAANMPLQRQIQQQFGHDYLAMSAAEKSRVLHQSGVAATMDTLTQDLVSGKQRPHQLALVANALIAGDSAAVDAEPSPAPTQGFVERLGLSTTPSMRHAERLEQRAAAATLETAR